MEFAEELYISKSIINTGLIISMLKNGNIPYGVFCVCSESDGKYRYEIMSCRELLKDKNIVRYKVLGLAAGKFEAYEVVRAIVEDGHDFV